MFSSVAIGSATDLGTDESAAWCRTNSAPSSASPTASLSRMSPTISLILSLTSSRFSSRPVERLSRTVTSSPLATSSLTIWEPMKPAPPVTR